MSQNSSQLRIVAPPKVDPNHDYTNLAFYRFVKIEDPKSLRQPLIDKCQELGICGKIVLAHEGINAMLSGFGDACDLFLDFLTEFPYFKDLFVKKSFSEHNPFRRIVVKIKPEIVTMRVPGVDAVSKTGKQLPPKKLRDWIRNGENIKLIDTRNDFEYKIGTFKGAIDPHTTEFNEFPQWIRDHKEELKDEKIVMFCTGGIRCEKATAWMLEEGFENVYQLEGGVLNYFLEINDAEKDWDGDLFVFDYRIAIKPDNTESPMRFDEIPDNRQTP